MSPASSLMVSPAHSASAPRTFRVVIEENIAIPADLVDLDSYCRWATSDEFPQRGKFSYLRGTIWVDLTMETAYTHNQIREAIGRILGQLIFDAKLGRFFPDGMFLRNTAADLATEPDGMFVSYDAFRSGRVKGIEREKPDFLEFEGTPDMVLEVVSDTSVQKDTQELRELYWRAGISEYWLVDARADSPRFDLLRHGRKGYVSTRKQAEGWLPSNVFGRSFQLTQTSDPLGDPLSVLNVRS